MAKASSGLVEPPNGRAAHDPQEVRVVTITPTVAESYLRLFAYERQRPLRQRHVEYLADAMRRGQFKPGAIELRTCGAQTFLVDGQHRLNAIAKSGMTYEMVVIERRVASMDEVDADYARTDRGMIRGMGDALAAYGVAETVGVAPSMLNRASAIVVPIIQGFERTAGAADTRSADMRQRALADWADEIRQYADIVSGHSGASRQSKRRLWVAGVGSVALVTLRHQPERATAFWSTISENDGLRRGQPERTLVDYMAEHPARTSSLAYVYCRAVAGAWNAFFEGRQLHLLKVLPETIANPIRIAGTPYDGKTVILPYALRTEP